MASRSAVAQANREKFWTTVGKKMEKKFKILPDEVIKELMKMYWIADICKATGLNSATLRSTINHPSRRFSADTAAKLSQFLYSHHTKMSKAFDESPVHFKG